ncbi:MAG: ATP-dependent Clp protease adaptor ClpS [Elusimicrobiota bacterium]
MPVATSRPLPTSGDVDVQAAWKTILFNCDCHSFEQVERILIKAIGCGLARARALSWEVHTAGSAQVYQGARQRCEDVADVIASVGLNVKVVQ